MKHHASWAMGGVLCLALGLFGIASPAFSQASPPPSDQVKQVEAFVNKAAELIDSNGKTIFSEFQKKYKDSEWFYGDTYLTVADFDVNVLFNANHPSDAGHNRADLKDANGKLFYDELATIAKSKGSGWVDYMWPKRGETQPSQKWSFVKAVTVDGVPGFVFAGFYPE